MDRITGLNQSVRQQSRRLCLTTFCIISFCVSVCFAQDIQLLVIDSPQPHPDGNSNASVKSIGNVDSRRIGARTVIETKLAESSVSIYDEKAALILVKAVQQLGGERYLQIRTQIGRGKFSVIKDGSVVLFQKFVDVIVFPDKERTDFRGNGSRTVQANTGTTGWVYDGDQELIKIQNAGQIANFKQGIRTSLDNLLRGHWKDEAVLAYVGKRPATLGKRNDVVKLTYKDGFAVEFEFSADSGLPQKAIYKRTNDEGEEIKEEDRYAQFIEIGGITSPFIVDRFTNGKPSSRINYETIEFNKSIPDAIFAKPSSAKEAKKELKL